MLADETYHEDALSTTEIGRSLGTDSFGPRDELTDADRDYLRRARAFVDNDVLPVTNDYWERAQFSWPLIKKMGTLGLVGDGIEGLRLPGDGHCPRGRNTRDGPAAGDRPGLRLCRENARGAAQIREIPGRHRRIGNGSRPPAIRIRCGRRRQPAEDTTEAVPVAAKTANDFKGQHQRTDMRFSPTPTHLFEPESRTQA